MDNQKSLMNYAIQRFITGVQQKIGWLFGDNQHHKNNRKSYSIN
jgi:hypothetical protein